jgi:hypothetical protein
MKSAYELAMERLRAADPEASAPLSDAQKAQLAEIDARYKAKMAERDIFLRKALAEAEAKAQLDEVEQIRRQMVSERARLEEECEAEKEKVRRGAR